MKKTGYLVIDSETLSHWNDAAILQIGLCYFSNEELRKGYLDNEENLNLPSLIDRAHSIKLNVMEQVQLLGRKTSKKVVDFWMSKSDELKARVLIPDTTDQSILEVFTLINGYLQLFGTDLKSVRLLDRRNYDVSKLQHVYEETINGANKDRYGLPYDYNATFELSQMFLFFHGDRYAGIKPEEDWVVKTPGFLYHDAGSDAALDAYRFLTVFAGNDSNGM